MKLSKKFFILFLLTFVFLLSSCSKRPVLGLNGMLQKRGKVLAKKDVDYCMKWAKKNSVDDERINPDDNLGTSGVKGAGAKSSFTFFGLINRDPEHYRHWVNRCLREKGYNPITWE